MAVVFTGTRQRVAFTGLLFSTMGVGTFVWASLGVLAPVFVEELGITRSEFGIALAVNTLGAAALSPFIGRWTDRVGGHTALLAVALASTVGFLILGVAGSLAVLILGSIVGIVGQAGCNPATNKLIAEDLPSGSQGIVVGIKQSGVQGFLFAGGLIMPAMALAWNRFSAYALFAGFSLLMAATAHFYLPASPHAQDRREVPERGPVPGGIWWITVYGFLIGVAGSMTMLFALYATEQLGQSVVVGGLVMAVIGITAAPARILWARHAERSGSYRGTLGWMAGMSAVSAGILLVGGTGTWWVIWPAAVLVGASSSSWNSVGMLALIVLAGPKLAGRASGIVLTGFLLGIGIGPVLFGWIVDQTSSYNPVWSISLVASLVGLAVMALWKPSPSQVSPH